MSKFRLGNYIFITWIGDHRPHHVHVYRDGRFIVKWNLDTWTPMKGSATARVIELLEDLRKKGVFR